MGAAMKREASTTRQPDKLFLIVVFVFGVSGAAAGVNWLSSGSIVIRQGGSRIGVGGPGPRPVPQPNAPVAGTIGADHALYYPLCVTWVALGVSMIGLAALSFFVPRLLFFKLSAYSCLAVLLLAAATVVTALSSGP
jgi:hypothetical protein